MKRLGYYPALVVLMSACLIGVGVFVFLSAQTMKKISGYKSSDDLYKASVKQLDEANAAYEQNQKTDRVYGEYLARWEQQEGKLDELQLKQKIQRIAETSGVQIYEAAPLNAPEKDDPNANKTQPKTPRRAARAGESPAEMVEIRIVFLGPFNGLMQCLTKMESELGGLRIVRTSWAARSPEEVKLTVGLRYKMMQAVQPQQPVAGGAAQ